MVEWKVSIRHIVLTRLIQKTKMIQMHSMHSPREESVENNKRILVVLREMRALGGDRIDAGEFWYIFLLDVL